MSSPVHHAKDLDAALMYAPPWAREERQAVPLVPAAAPDEELLMPGGIDDDDAFSGDLAVLQLQRRLALEPEEVPAPPRRRIRRDRTSGMIARFFGVTGAAALIAWAAVSLPGARLNRGETEGVGSAATTVTTVTVAAGKQDQLPTAKVDQPSVSDERGAANEAPPADIKLPATPVEPPPVSAPQSAPAPQPPPPPPRSVVLRLDEGEIVTLLKRGQDFLNNGDLVAARLLFRRAAEAGSASAALALGMSFDPFVIQQLGAIGVSPDTAKAREWYQKAEELGSETASQRLAKLAQSR